MTIDDKRIKVISGETHKKIMSVALGVNRVLHIKGMGIFGNDFIEIEYDKELDKNSLNWDLRNLYFYMITFFLIVYYRIVPSNWSLLIIALICINILWRKEIYYRGVASK